MKITLTQAASEMKVRIYSVSYRRVLETECGAVNTKEVTVIITRDKIARLAAGTYFMVVSGKSNGGEKAVSKPQELIILK